MLNCLLHLDKQQKRPNIESYFQCKLNNGEKAPIIISTCIGRCCERGWFCLSCRALVHGGTVTQFIMVLLEVSSHINWTVIISICIGKCCERGWFRLSCWALGRRSISKGETRERCATAEIRFCRHHRGHASSSYFCLNNESSLPQRVPILNAKCNQSILVQLFISL